MTNFSDLGLSAPILKAVASEGYTTPTPIQTKGIPAILSGADILGLAQTGTGKTASFVLPLLHRISENRNRPAPKTCGALILAPTRELASQIADNIRAYGQKVRHSATVVVGGARPVPQIRALARGMDIVVATPGRLLDHMSTGAVSLDQTTTIVLDEADHMFDLGFLPSIRRIMAALPRERQTILLSATMPQQIRALANDFLSDPVETAVAPAAKPIDRIAQRVLLLEKEAKRQALVDVLKDPDMDRAIVFTRTKHGADKVAKHLEKAGLSASAIHGNKSQGQRQRTLDAFRGGRTPILVATDIAARGIDVDGVSHVVNFELPNVPESYVHRIGRTARAGRSGVAVSFCDMSERPYLRDIEKLIGRTLVERDDDPVPQRKGRRGNRNGGSKSDMGTRRKRPQQDTVQNTGGDQNRTDGGERPARTHKKKPSARPRRHKQNAPRGGDGGFQGRKRPSRSAGATAKGANA